MEATATARCANGLVRPQHWHCVVAVHDAPNARVQVRRAPVSLTPSCFSTCCSRRSCVNTRQVFTELQVHACS